MTGLDATRYTEGLTRIAVGIFKKFIIADSLAIGMALNATNAEQATSTIGVWILLYGYALRLYFDFSGYSDIAIGIGMLFGIKLPENFDRPYLKNNITTFWQSWHITLSNWARFYVFSPLSRFLLTRQPKPSPIVVVLSTQMATMVVIGLWHGVTINFLIWGVWHGIGLFVHKQWSDRTRKWYRRLNDTPRLKQAWTVAGWFITFHFVVVGWVWFALPEFGQSLDVFGKLVGLN
jgi:alginate O-acetyltransferase complex protein AlgI